MAETKEGTCDCCESNNVVTIAYKDDHGPELWFCELCGSTLTSLHWRHYHTDRDALKTTCYVDRIGNMNHWR